MTTFEAAMNQEFIANKLKRELRFLFPLLSDPNVTDIHRNPDGRIWIEYQGLEKELCQETLTDAEVLTLVGTIASGAGTTINPKRPQMDATLPWGQRFHCFTSPVTDAPSFSIRNHSARLFSLNDYVSSGRMTAEVKEHIRTFIRKRENIIISGGTGSGKTTLTNAILLELKNIHPKHRLCVMEDTRELVIHNDDVVQEKACEYASMRDLLAGNLREKPDRIIMGEIRGAEAHDLLKTWNTGHPGGISTVHANSAYSALARFEQLVLEAENLNIPYLRSLIADAVNVVIHIERRPGIGPVVAEVLKIDHMLGSDGRYKGIPVYKLPDFEDELLSSD